MSQPGGEGRRRNDAYDTKKTTIILLTKMEINSKFVSLADARGFQPASMNFHSFRSFSTLVEKINDECRVESLRVPQ